MLCELVLEAWRTELAVCRARRNGRLIKPNEARPVAARRAFAHFFLEVSDANLSEAKHYPCRRRSKEESNAELVDAKNDDVEKSIKNRLNISKYLASANQSKDASQDPNSSNQQLLLTASSWWRQIFGKNRLLNHCHNSAI